MKLPTNDIHTETNLNTKEYQFKIDENDQGIIFEMLRSKIYKDPIGSICREIASNARDAHRESKKPNLPIEITINNKTIMNNGSITIDFKDFGTGISEDRMENIFCKYAASTKRETNTMTGGFGLGAKTPFSYSDTFFIKTVYDKILYTYTAYIDESKKGKITLHKKVKVEEGNSTSIIVPIKNDNDRNRFESACKLFTQYWRVQPIFKNFYLKGNENDVQIVEKTGFSLVRKSNRHQGPIALIDGIPYIIDTNADTLFNRQLNYSTPVTVMTFKNGELDISINRENLQYTKRTINSLNKRFKAIQKEFIEHFNNYIKDSEHYLEACYRMYKAGRSSNGEDADGAIYNWLNFYKSSGKINFQYKGEEIVDSIDIKYLRFSKYILSGNSVHIERFYHSQLLELYNTDIYLLAEGKSTSTAVNYEILKNSKVKQFIVVGLRGFQKRKPAKDASNWKVKEYETAKKRFDVDIKEEYKFITEKIGKKLIDYSSIKPKKDSDGERSLPVSTHVKIYNKHSWKYGYDWNNLTLTRSNILNDINKNKYTYLVVNKSGDHTDLKKESTLDYFIAAMYNEKDLICITKRQEKYFKGYTPAKELLDKLDKNFLSNYADYVVLKQLMSNYEDKYSDYKFGDNIKTKVTEAKDNYYKLKKNNKILNLYNSKDAVENHIDKKTSTFVKEFETTIKTIPKVYPLINHISSWNMNDNIVKEINFYITCKEQTL